MRKKTGFLFIDMLIGVMLAVVVGIMPLVVRFSLRPFPPEIAVWRGTDTYHDMFAYWKAWFIGLPAFVTVFFTVSDYLTRGKFPEIKKFLKQPPIFISLVYLFFVLLSAVLSDYTTLSWWGAHERFEGAIMWIVYLTIFISAKLYVRNEVHMKFILYGLIFSSILMGLVGLSQFAGRDFFNTAAGNWYVTAGTIASGVGTVFEIAHGTLYNPNTFGKYTAMVAPILLIAAVTYRGGIKTKIALFVGGGLMFLGIFASGSLGGFVGLATALVLLVITVSAGFVYRLKNKSGSTLGKRAYLVILSTVAAALLFVVILFNVSETVSERFTGTAVRLRDAVISQPVIHRDYIFDGNTMTAIYGDNNLMTFTITNWQAYDWFTVHTADGEAEFVIHPTDDEDVYLYTGEVFGYQFLTVERHPQFFIYHAGGIPFFLTFQGGNIMGIGAGGTFVNLSERPPSWGFYGRETWGSNRGYIWSRTFPLMPRRTLIGSGPDTFVNIFPQEDLVNKWRFYQDPYMIIDKAHNLFFQTWINTGGLSAVALFALFGHYIFVTFFSLVKSKGEQLSSYGLRLGLFCGIGAFITAALATDSTIGSTGVFFVLLGLGYALNEIRLKQQSIR